MRRLVSASVTAALLCGATVLQGKPDPSSVEEVLHYGVKYLGLFSGGAEIPIADVRLSRGRFDPPGDIGPLVEERLTVTSENQPYVESLYPFRLRFRSLYSGNDTSSMAFEKYRRTDRVRHEVTWLDKSTGNVSRFRKGVKRGERSLPPAVLSNWMKPASGFRFYKFARHGMKENMVDQLALLSRVRKLEMAQGNEFEFPVTDGKRLLRYRVMVEAKKIVEIAGRRIKAWKLRFDGFRKRKGVTESYHRPVYVWLEDDSQRTPIKFESRHELGRFTIELLDRLPSGL